MSQENVEAFKRGLDAYNRRDLDALLETLDPDVEWHPALAVVLGRNRQRFAGIRGCASRSKRRMRPWPSSSTRFRRSGTWGLRSSRSDAPAFAAKGAASRLTRPSSC
jgi:ketosteroid isomerase-like protein